MLFQTQSKSNESSLLQSQSAQIEQKFQKMVKKFCEDELQTYSRDVVVMVKYIVQAILLLVFPVLLRVTFIKKQEATNYFVDK